jgi:recombination protein RecA
MSDDIIARLEKAGLIAEKFGDLGFVGTGSYALNKIVSGRYDAAIPIGGITQFRGESSTAKTAFVLSTLREAQQQGYWCIYLDAENALSPGFAKIFGINLSSNFVYVAPNHMEEAFDSFKKIITLIRETDKETPIVAAIDSLAVLQTKKEYEQEDFEHTPVDGAYRAKVMGFCLRKANGLLRKNNVALIVVNQIRHKIGVMFGNPETNAAGGKSLDYYLAIDLKVTSNKTGDIIKDDNKKPVGIKGRVDNKKNKVSVPFRSCDFELMFDKGLDPMCGIIPFLVEDGLVIDNGNGRYQLGDVKFTKTQFPTVLKTAPQFADLRNLFGIEGIENERSTDN